MFVWYRANDSEKQWYGDYENIVSVKETTFLHGTMPKVECIYRLSGKTVTVDTLADFLPYILQKVQASVKDILIWGFDADLEHIKCISTGSNVCWPECAEDISDFVRNHESEDIYVTLQNIQELQRLVIITGQYRMDMDLEYLYITVNDKSMDFKSGSYKFTNGDLEYIPTSKEIREQQEIIEEQRRLELQTAHDIESLLSGTDYVGDGLRDIPNSYSLNQAYAEGNGIIKAGLDRIINLELLDIPKETWDTLTVQDVLKFGWDSLYETCREILSAIL